MATLFILHDCMIFFYGISYPSKTRQKVGRSISVHRTSCNTRALGRLDKSRRIGGAAAGQDRDNRPWPRRGEICQRTGVRWPFPRPVPIVFMDMELKYLLSYRPLAMESVLGAVNYCTTTPYREKKKKEYY